MPRMKPPRIAPDTTPAPPIITMMNALIEIQVPSPLFTPEIATRSDPARPARAAPIANPIIP